MDARTPTSTDPATVRVVAPPPVITLGALGLGLGLQLVRRWRLLGPARPRARRVAGAALAAGSVGWAGWGVRTMRAAETGIEHSHPATALVTSGPFRYSRNPLYLGLAGVYWGVTLLANSGWLAALFPGWVVLMQRGVIAREEPYMRGRFGDAYAAYTQRVRRWL